jgi:bacteriorhodopsin
MANSKQKSRMQHKWLGWYTSTIFCLMSIAMFIISVTVLLHFVETDPAAMILGGGKVPEHQWALTQMAFATCLFLDFISWLWTVDKDKSRLFYLALVINGLPVITYGMLANGMAPVLIDVHGRRLVVIRYLQWLFTTPSMLYLYSIISSIPTSEVVTSMVLGATVIILGFIGSIIRFPFDLLSISLAIYSFSFVVRFLIKTISLAIEESSLEDTSYRGALGGARWFMVLTWVGIPVVWTMGYFHLVSYLAEEVMFEFFDFSSKAGISCMILHSSIKTYAEKQDEKAQAELQQERNRTIEALQESARMKVRDPQACHPPLLPRLYGLGLAGRKRDSC